jgi:hypothetical protein
MKTAGTLTVKHIEEGAYESVIQAISTSYDPGSGPDRPPTFTAYGVPLRPGSADEGGYASYSSGAVYVMNEAGATVARYDLDSARQLKAA